MTSGPIGEVDQVDHLLGGGVHLQRWPVFRHGAAMRFSWMRKVPKTMKSLLHNFSFPSCDQTSNCSDESDEDNCKLLSMKVGTDLFLSAYSFNTGQLQQEDRSVQFRQSAEGSRPGQNQCVPVGHRYFENSGSRPHLHSQVSPRSGMVHKILVNCEHIMCFDMFHFCFKGMITASNT